jgi:acetone carboxylase gamma subunit
MKVTTRKAHGRKAERYLVKCTCGEKNCASLEIYKLDSQVFEIAGVLDTSENWYKLFTNIGLIDIEKKQ